jgi:hypothetical protein
MTTPIIGNATQSHLISTPCLDENEALNILQGLISFDRSDPLFAESQHVGNCLINEPAQKRARCDNKLPSTTQAAPTPVTSTSTSDAPPPQEAPTNEKNQQQDNAIAKAILEAAKLITNAFDSNTRALRCQEKTQEKVVSELSRIERKLNQMERNQAAKLRPDPQTPTLKENK